MNDTITVEIPPDVRDNRETVTDYAYSRHHSPVTGLHTAAERDNRIDAVTRFPVLGLTHYQWHDVNQGNRHGWGAGHRCQFDMIVNQSGTVVNLFHTEYFTRVACCTHDARYATHYASVTDQGGVTTEAMPYCGECMHHLRCSARETYMTVNESEPLLIDQHD